jgi:Mor family transcriptional regulator
VAKNKSGASIFEGRGASIERELRSIIESALTSMAESNLPPKDLAENLVTAIFESFGGLVVYIPMGYKSAIIRRNQTIFTDWQNGMPTNELAQKYKLVISTIYDVISKSKKMIYEKDQKSGSKDDLGAVNADQTKRNK